MQQRFGTVGEPLSICGVRMESSIIQMALERLVGAKRSRTGPTRRHPEGFVRFSPYPHCQHVTTVLKRPVAHSLISRWRNCEGAGAVVVGNLSTR
jgi:hypothetical protein